MKPLSEITCCVVDTSGLFIPLARELGKAYGRTLYTNPAWQKSDAVINEAVIGDGFPEIETCWDLWTKKNGIDLFVFPDLQAMGMQQELREQGFPVWGAGHSMLLETNRLFFLQELERLGLDVPEYVEVRGVSALADYLKDKRDIFIKVSKWRGSWETCHWKSWDADSHKLDLWAFKLGGVREKVDFLCFPKIDTKLEIGADTYCVAGQWPDTMLHGIEKKDSAYLSAVTPRSEMPSELTDIMGAFAKHLPYATQWSMEVRVTDDAAYFIDATIRGGMPSTGSQCSCLKNLPEIIYHGAMGELVQPEYAAKFTAECRVTMEGVPGSWETIIVDPALEPALKLAECCMVDGQIWFPPREPRVQNLGWLVASDDDPKALISQMKHLATLLPPGVSADIPALADVISEIETEEEDGIPFTDQSLPAPEEVLKDE